MTGGNRPAHRRWNVGTFTFTQTHKRSTRVPQSSTRKTAIVNRGKAVLGQARNEKRHYDKRHEKVDEKAFVSPSVSGDEEKK